LLLLLVIISGHKRVRTLERFVLSRERDKERELELNTSG
jgi:hypothetical protein